MQAVAGIAVLLALAWILGEDRRHIPWRVVIVGLSLQLGLAVLLLDVPPARGAILLLNHVATALQTATDAGTGFVFGYLGGGALPFAVTQPGSSVILGFKILPLVLVISALSRLLFHWGVMQRLTAAFAWLLRRSMGIDGALALAAAVHIFVGMVEAPLLVRPYLARMQRGEMFAMMSCGMAGVAGTVMVIYATILGPVIPGALGVILTASVISTPAALAVAALMVPFGPGDGQAATLGPQERADSAIDAVVRGTAEGVGPLVGIATMLLVTVALVSLANAALGKVSPGGGGLTLQQIFAFGFRPIMWLIGVPWAETGQASLLMGTKTVLNEFVAYLNLAALPPTALSAHSRLIMTYAMCGFANFGSLGIMIGGVGAMVPERRAEIAALGLRSLASGSIATCLSGALAGLLG